MLFDVLSFDDKICRKPDTVYNIHLQPRPRICGGYYPFHHTSLEFPPSSTRVWFTPLNPSPSNTILVFSPINLSRFSRFQWHLYIFHVKHWQIAPNPNNLFIYSKLYVPGFEAARHCIRWPPQQKIASTWRPQEGQERCSLTGDQLGFRMTWSRRTADILANCLCTDRQTDRSFL
jgi:hypothetical protein